MRISQNKKIIDIWAILWYNIGRFLNSGNKKETFITIIRSLIVFLFLFCYQPNKRRIKMVEFNKAVDYGGLCEMFELQKLKGNPKASQIRQLKLKYKIQEIEDNYVVLGEHEGGIPYGEELKYSELCNFLGEEPKTANSKDKQLNEFKNFYEIEEVLVGKQVRYKIIQKYETPLVKSTEEEWYAAFCYVVSQKMKNPPNSKNKYKSIWYTKTSMLYDLGFVNDNYKFIMDKTNRALLRATMNSGIAKTQRTFEEDYGMCSAAGDILIARAESGLNRMQKEGLLNYAKSYTVMYTYIDNVFGKKVGSMSAFVSEKDDELFRILNKVDTLAIDRVRKELGYEDIKLFNKIRFSYYDLIAKERNKIIKTNAEVIEKMIGFIDVPLQDFIGFTVFLDTKYIIPNDIRMNSFSFEIIKNAKEILNDNAMHRLTKTQNTNFTKYKSIATGFNEIYINLNTIFSFTKELENEILKRQEKRIKWGLNHSEKQNKKRVSK